MPRYKLTIEYAGTRYSGWQVQKNARTVAGEIERAVAEAAGRAPRNCTAPGAPTPACTPSARWRTSTSRPPGRAASSRARVNERLPHDIVIVDAERVPHRFHARHSAVSRSYLYQVARRKTAFGKPFVWWVREPLDLDADAAGPPALSRDCTTSARSRTTTPTRPRRAWRSRASRSWRRARCCCSAWRDRTSCGRWCAGSSACWSRSGEAGCRRQQAAALLGSDSDLPPRLTAPPSGLFLEHVRYPGDARPPGPQPVLRSLRL